MRISGVLGGQGMFLCFSQDYINISDICIFHAHLDIGRKLKGHGAASRGIPGYQGFIPGKARELQEYQPARLSC